MTKEQGGKREGSGRKASGEFPINIPINCKTDKPTFDVLNLLGKGNIGLGIRLLAKGRMPAENRVPAENFSAPLSRKPARQIIEKPPVRKLVPDDVTNFLLRKRKQDLMDAEYEEEMRLYLLRNN